MSATLNTTPGASYKSLLPESVLAEAMREAACRKLTGTFTVVVCCNQGGFTSASYGIQDRPKRA